MKVLVNIGGWVIAFLAGNFCANIASSLVTAMTGSSITAGFVALGVFLWVMIVIGTRFKRHDADLLNPPAFLVDEVPVKVLAEVKEALAIKQFSDSKWHMDTINEHKGLAYFSFRMEVPKEAEVMKAPTVSLRVQVVPLTRLTAVELNYETTASVLNVQDSLTICEETTAYIRAALLAQDALAAKSSG